MNLFSPECKEIFTALCKAQAEFPIIPKSGYNPHFKSTYSTLDDYERACRPAATKFDLGWTQILSWDDSTASHKLVTLLVHSSGQWMQSVVHLNPAKNDAQALGSYISYMRRYALSSLLGVSGSEDDDGNTQSVQEHKPITQEQFEILAGLIKSLPNAVKVHKDILSFNKIDKLEDLPDYAFKNVKSYLDKLKG